MTRTRFGIGMVAALLLALPLGAQQAVELPARDRAIEPALQPVYSIGSLDGEEWETFGEVSQVGFDGDGNLYVLDRQSMRVVVVDPDGGFVRRFGQAGEGPGEWRFPSGMGVLPDGRVVISDGRHRAFLVHGADGSLVNTVPMSGDGSFVSLGTLHVDPRGGALYSAAGAGIVMMRSGPGGATPTAPEGRPIERVEVDGEGSVSPFFTGWKPTAPEAGPVRIGGGGGGPSFSVGGAPFFEPGMHVAPLPDGGLAVVDTSTYAVRLVGPDGRERSRVTRAIAPVAVTERIQEAEKERQLALLEAGGGPQMRIVARGSDGTTEALGGDRMRDMQRQMIEDRGFYPEIPVVRRLAASPAGTLWVERSMVDPDAPGPIDLFRTNGDYLGTIPADGIRVPVAFGPDGLVAYVDRDEFDVPTIRVERLPSEIR